MKSLIVKAGLLPSVIHVPPSKSYANRSLILAALKPEKFVIRNLPEASDVTFLVKAFKQIGINLSLENGVATVLNSFPNCEIPNGATIDIGEGGTTARFLASLLVRGREPYVLVLGSRLKDRPWDEFIKVVQKLGGKAELNGDKLSLKGPIQTPKILEVDCSQTTQFASGFKLALAFCETEIIPRNMLSSESYWAMTNAQIAQFKSNTEFTVPMDWSSASYPLAFGALKQTIFFPQLKADSFQADSKFLAVLNQLGCVQETPEGIHVRPTGIKKNFDLDVADCLDLVPTLAFFLAHVDGSHLLRNVSNLVHKESDRLYEVTKLIGKFGFKASSEGPNLRIEGSSSHASAPVDLELPEDHRIVMAAALFLRYHQGGSIFPALAVQKSYPDFFKLFSV
jgi:3-phosphoshikimate 1-carboxyvinyltransferase